MRCAGRLLLVIVFIVVISQVVSAAYLYCEDSDSGSVYDVQGTLTYGFKEPFQTISDYCDEGADGEDPSCSGDNCFIVEYYCTGSKNGWNFKTEVKKCVDLGYTGCSDGACTGTPGPEETCSDGIQNQDEEGIDCGGNSCDPCESCSDDMLNQDETDVDCGGSCPTCDDGESCSKDSDCSNSYCNPDDTCTTPSCSDGIENQDEEGVDCGGDSCDPCESCSDDIKNQDEEDVDCGGNSCDPCESCSDGVMNQDEEDVDCGGNSCDPCEERISDSELLQYIESWAQGELDPDPAANDQRLLEIIDIWKRT